MGFPDHIYVHEDTRLGANALEVIETTDESDDGDTIAIYKLVEIRTMQVTRELV